MFRAFKHIPWFRQAATITPYKTWNLCLWSIWINPVTYPIRLMCVAISLKVGMGFLIPDSEDEAVYPKKFDPKGDSKL